MNRIQSLLHRLAETKPMRPFAAVFETLDGIIFGPREVTAGPPHVVDNIEIKRYMSVAIIALLPSTVSAILFWGARVLAVIIVCYVAGGLVEVAFALIRKREIEEGFLVTGLIFPLILPPTVPLWVAAVGIIVGTFFGKEVFGGTGRNIFNPALVGRLFITIAFPGMMSSAWQAPFTDTVTAATPLAIAKSEGFAGLIDNYSYADLLFGGAAGSMGEVFRIGIIAGGVFLLLTKVGNWRVPVSYLASVFVFSLAGWLLFPSQVAPPVFQLLSGGLLYGAFFMATDPVTSPVHRESKLIYGAFLGLITVIIRSYSGYTEGVMFSIIFMNALSPLIDHFVLKAKFREARQ